MKKSPLVPFLAIALLVTAAPHSLLAADVAVDISSFAPRDPNVVVRQIELNVAIKQYEKVMMEKHEASLQYEFGTPETGLSDEQRKQCKARAERKVTYLENMSEDLRERIRKYVEEANKMMQAIEEAKAKEKAKQ